MKLKINYKHKGEGQQKTPANKQESKVGKDKSISVALPTSICSARIEQN